MVQSHVTLANPDGVLLQSAFLEAQQLFQMQMMSLAMDELEPAIATKLQSIQIEINKQLRLLAMDVMFLQTARKSVTAQQRQAQMGDRIQLLLNYCQAILEMEGHC